MLRRLAGFGAHRSTPGRCGGRSASRPRRLSVSAGGDAGRAEAETVEPAVEAAWSGAAGAATTRGSRSCRRGWPDRAGGGCSPVRPRCDLESSRADQAGAGTHAAPWCAAARRPGPDQRPGARLAVRARRRHGGGVVTAAGDRCVHGHSMSDAYLLRDGRRVRRRCRTCQRKANRTTYWRYRVRISAERKCRRADRKAAA